MHFIAFEGLDGAGKSTLIQGLKAELDKHGLPHIITREPGGTQLGNDIRQLLLRTRGEFPVPKAEALLYQADRAQHVETVIRPALAAQKWVLSDRFSASSIAFQTGGRDLRVEEIEWMNEFSTSHLQPDLYVLLDLSVQESLRRLQGRPRETDRFEREQKEFHQRVRDAYLNLARAEPKRWLVLSADQAPAMLVNSLLMELKGRKWLA